MQRLVNQSSHCRRHDSSHWCCTRFLVLIMSVIALVLLAGCNKDAVAEYDRLQGQTLVEALNAIHNRDHKLAQAKLERLSQLLPTSEYIQQLIIRERENQAIVKIAKPLEKGDIAGAWKKLEAAEIAVGRTPGIRDVRKSLEGLRTVSEYQKRLPFTNADTAAVQAAKLPPAATLGTIQRYKNWHGRQLRMVKRLQLEQQQEVGAEMLEELDVALVTDDRRAQALMGQLRALVPETAFLKHQGLPIEELKTTVHGVPLDLICFVRAERHDPATRAAILKIYRSRRPFSLCGLYLQTWSAFAAGNNALALERFASLREAVPSSRVDLLQPYFRSLLKESQEPPSPTVHGVLQRLHQFQNSNR